MFLTHASSPVLIVGMPRSGTKLAAALLNNHPRIFIPEREFHSLPYLTAKYSDRSGSLDLKRRDAVVRDWYRGPLAHNLRIQGIEIDRNKLQAAIAADNWGSLLGRLAMISCNAELQEDEGILWGDRTTGLEQIRSLAMIKASLPSSRVLHLIRDPRDCAASINRMWGQSPVRAAMLWQACVREGRRYGRTFKNGYMEISYEALIRDPEQIMRGVCQFLRLEFKPGMASLTAPVREFLPLSQPTATDHLNHIDFNNSGRFRTTLTPNLIYVIERITVSEAQSTYGYGDRRPCVMSGLRHSWLAAHDLWQKVRFNIRQRGWMRGLQYYLNLLWIKSAAPPLKTAARRDRDEPDEKAF
ncbi:MAG: sulfotransferase [Candidatus Omnitrophica bacterium]|jgi:hypothetical protein|nr:sulfotransferase [Candidatus Omnitrophota bacterium]